MNRLTLISGAIALIAFPFVFALELGLGGLGDPAWAAASLFVYAMVCGLATIGGLWLANAWRGEGPLSSLWGGTFGLIGFLLLFAWLAFMAGDSPDEIVALASYLAMPGSSTIALAVAIEVVLRLIGIGMATSAKFVEK